MAVWDSLAASVALSALAGCATLVEGTQQVKIDTRPGGADCTLYRQGKVIGRIAGTPGFTTIGNSRYGVTIRCSEKGYLEASYYIRAGDRGVKLGTKSQAGDFASATDMGYDEAALYDVTVHLMLVPQASRHPGGPQ